MIQPRAIAALFVVAVAVPAAVSAQGTCVECKGPDRVYRCSIKDSDKVQGIRGAARAIDYVCMTEVARAGGHESCRVGSSFAGPCIGQAFEIDMEKVALPTAPPGEPAAPGAGTPGAEAPAKAATPPAKGPPQTLEELARLTVTKSKEQMSAADESMRQAGGAVKGGIQKTWECVVSLFSRC